MTTLYVQFSDASGTAISTYFSGPQADGVYDNYGTVETSDARWTTFYNALKAAGCALGLPEPTTA